MGRYNAEVPRSGVAAFICFAPETKLGQTVSAGASALYILPPGYAAGTLGIGV